MPFQMNPLRSPVANAQGWFYYIERVPNHPSAPSETKRLKAWLSQMNMLSDFRVRLLALEQTLENEANMPKGQQMENLFSAPMSPQNATTASSNLASEVAALKMEVGKLNEKLIDTKKVVTLLVGEIANLKQKQENGTNSGAVQVGA